MTWFYYSAVLAAVVGVLSLVGFSKTGQKLFLGVWILCFAVVVLYGVLWFLR